MDFLDVPSMFEDALRQLASNPCFAYLPDPTQTEIPLAGSHATPVQYAEELGTDPLQLDTNNKEVFWDAAPLAEDPQQDFSSTLWPLSLIDSHVDLGSTLDSPAELWTTRETDRTAPFFHPSNIDSPDVYESRTGLNTIDEELDSTAETLNLNIFQGSLGLETLCNQTLSSSSQHIITNQDYGQPSHTSNTIWQPLTSPSINESCIPSQTKQHSSAEESSFVLVKVDIEVSRAGQGSTITPPPLNDLISNFESNPSSPLPKRSRRPFTEIGKTKVKQVRVSGACAFCRARKVPCTPTGACTACVKLASGNPLADHICVRTKLRDTFVGVRALHGSSFDNRRARLTPLLSSLTGQPRPIQFSVERYDDHDSVPFRNNDHHIRTLASLDIKVMQCSAPSLCRWKRLTKVRGIYITSDIFDGQRYVIVPSSLPSIDEFDRFGRKILLASDGGHSGNLTLLLDQFLTAYCARQHNTEVRAIANLTSRIASLNNLVAYGFLNLRDGSYDLLEQLPSENHPSQRYISETVHDQIRLLAAEGLEPAEKIVFHALDDINKYICGHEHARMIIGICLLRLMLLYRDRLVRDEIRLSLPKQKKWHQYRLEKASFMYRRLTVTYGALCREYDTPLTMQWEDEDYLGSNGPDGLKDVYLKLQPAFREFCNKKLSLQYDDVLKILLANPTKQQKAKKRRKTCR
ncbi:uncharacterized protein LY89DRAFT_731375 [Mollisia scopiformis]|uniref:Zn(2)-C6 fungal-type domain-containing protein n=1 Tax=Mollisia scopiformis TaxID=149040 RepID=A0A194XJ47_MOLSC|nr:uncharacterized protein LY89DRAFT_731375 [Mollisia scopiformis]KUJ20146.1 hypothetical protein LY89DRAFT_731375 [Mollisia scopiformis]